MSGEPRIEEVFTLPSKGLVYNDDVNPEIILSSMTTRHEMLRLSNTDENYKILAQIMDDCIKSDLGISAYDLCLGDFQFLLFKLRTVTFGPEYELGGKCPFCGFEQTSIINLDELEIKEFDESINDIMDIELPVTGSKVEFKLQTPRILDRVNAKTREYMRRHKDSDENPVILYNIISSIDLIDDEIPNAIMLEEWCKNLPLADTNAIINRIDLINDQIGVDMFVEDNCKICGTEYIVPFRFNSTFFRPIH